MEWIPKAQQEVARAGLDGWLIYDFRGSNRLAKRFLSLGGLLTRRVFLFIPPEGEATLLVHAIERGSLPELPCRVASYSSRQSLERELGALLPRGRVALEYSPRGDNPYLAQVDAGTVELLRELGVEPVSSGDLLQAFSAWTPAQQEAHRRAAEHVARAKDTAFAFIELQAQMGREVRETDVQSVIVDYFEQHSLVCDHPAIVGFGPHSGDPHYSPRRGADRALRPGDLILIDLWAKLPGDSDPYADITWTGVYGEPSDEQRRVFEVVAAARDLGVSVIRDAYAGGRYPEGREVDAAVRAYIAERGYGEAFTHRTGHSLGLTATHGDAVHLDDYETRDTRSLIPGVGVTIEPGVYLPEFGVRSEINLIMREGGPEITTPVQAELIVIPSAN